MGRSQEGLGGGAYGKGAWPQRWVGRDGGVGLQRRGRGLNKGVGGWGLTVIFLSLQMEGRVRAA